MTALFTLEQVNASCDIVIMNRDLVASDMVIEEYNLDIDAIREHTDPRFLDSKISCGWTVKLAESVLMEAISALDIIHEEGRFQTYGGLRGVSDGWEAKSTPFLAAIRNPVQYRGLRGKDKKLEHFIRITKRTIDEALAEKDMLIQERIDHINNAIREHINQHNEHIYKHIKEVAVDLMHIDPSIVLTDEQKSFCQQEREAQESLEAKIKELQTELDASVERQKAVERKAVQAVLQSELGEHGNKMLERAKLDKPKKKLSLFPASH